MNGFLRHFSVCNNFDPSKYVPFFIEGQRLGLVSHEIVSVLVETCHFALTQDGLVLLDRFSDFAARTKALAFATNVLTAHFGKDLRHEKYPVFAEWGMEPLAAIDRVAVPWFGTRGFGVHVNAFVRKADGLYVWVAERAGNRLVDPGKLDHLIAGGAPLGISIEDNLVKEAWEEAGVPEELARRAVPCGTVRYMCANRLGLRNDTIFVFDLELPEDFTPVNNDGEVAEFRLMPLRDVVQIVRWTDFFKFNCNLVLVDFFLRYGGIADSDPELEALRIAVRGVRGG